MVSFNLNETTEKEILEFWRTSTRLDKACASVDEVEEIAPDMFLVRSESKPSKRYLVDYRAKTCECPDYVYRGSVNGIVCKHWMSVHLAKFRKPMPEIWGNTKRSLTNDLTPDANVGLAKHSEADSQ